MKKNPMKKMGCTTWQKEKKRSWCGAVFRGRKGRKLSACDIYFSVDLIEHAKQKLQQPAPQMFRSFIATEQFEYFSKAIISSLKDHEISRDN